MVRDINSLPQSQVHSIRLAGRENWSEEPFPRDIYQIVDEVVHTLLPIIRGENFTFFGHRYFPTVLKDIWAEFLPSQIPGWVILWVSWDACLCLKGYPASSVLERMIGSNWLELFSNEEDQKKSCGRDHKNLNARWWDELKSFFQECVNPRRLLAPSLWKRVPVCWVILSSHGRLLQLASRVVILPFLF